MCWIVGELIMYCHLICNPMNNFSVCDDFGEEPEVSKGATLPHRAKGSPGWHSVEICHLFTCVNIIWISNQILKSLLNCWLPQHLLVCNSYKEDKLLEQLEKLPRKSFFCYSVSPAGLLHPQSGEQDYCSAVIDVKQIFSTIEKISSTGCGKCFHLTVS